MFCEMCGGDYYGEANGKQLCRKCYDREDISKENKECSFDILTKERDQLHAELTKDFTKEQFRLLHELIETELELEKYCNQ